MVNRAGQRFGNYRLLHSLGQGGFAEVYLAEHIHLHTYAAVKILHGQITARDLQAFTREAQIIAHLQHPNIIRVLDFGVQEHTPFLIMEYAPNGTLRDLYPQGEQLPLSTLIPSVKQLASGLQYAHERKIIHRDVKPVNMLVGSQQEVLLSDFGVSAIIHSTGSQSMESIAGTILYMAPEQIRGRATPASDQYALGVVVYEWLCGTLPFVGTFSEVASQHCSVPPPPLRKHLATIPTEVEYIVLRALAKDPRKRFTNIQEFADALEQASATKSLPTQRMLSPNNPIKLVPGSAAFHTHYGSKQRSKAVADPAIPSQRGRHLSRRALLVGSVGLVLAGGASVVWFSRASGSLPQNILPVVAKDPTASLSPSPTQAAPASLSPTPGPTLPSAMYTGGTDDFLYALRPQDGSVLWKFQAKDWMNSRPVVGNGVVYAGSNDHSLYALRSTNGAVLWQFQTGGKVVSWPLLVNNVLYFGSWDGSVYALQADTGSVLWSYQTGGLISSPTQVANGVVYIGSSDHNLYALQASTGKLLWSFQTGADVAALATVSDEVVYVGSGDHFLYALRVADGSELWRYQTGGAIYSSPEIVDGVIYIGSSDHFIYALRVSDHSVLWRYQTGDAVASLPTVSDGVLHTGSSDGFVYALRTQDGSVLWRYQTGGAISSKAILADGIVYIGGSNGLFALQANNGSLAWKFGDAAFTTPTLAF